MTKPTEMEKRVAEAMRKRYPIGFEVIPQTTGQALKFYNLLAKDAIRVMTKPTKDMVDAGQSALDDCIDTDWDSGGDGNSHNSFQTIRSDAPAKMFNAMIEAASPTEEK